MQPRDPLGAIAALVGLSLVPAIAIYWLFGSLSSANVTWANEEVKLGGPIAGFFAILLILDRIHSRLLRASSREQALGKPFVGRWRLTSKSSKHLRMATGEVDARLTDDGLLVLSGDIRDANGMVNGDWESKEVFCTPTGLAYRYVITDRAAEADAVSIAFCTLRIADLDMAGRPRRLSGTWDVIVPNHHAGTVILERADV